MYFNEVVKDYRYYHIQQHWYDMRYILDQIGERIYHTQPFCQYSEQRIKFLDGLKNDINHQPAASRNAYQTFLKDAEESTNLFFTSYHGFPIQRAFIRWRLKEMEN